MFLVYWKVDVSSRKYIFAKYTINKLAMYLYHILQRKFIDNIFKSNIKQINNELRT